MVIPSDVTTTSRKVKKYVGNNLRINLLKNNTALQVTGNNCKVDIGENSGTAKIIGDSCELTVRKGKGAIHYIGNYGKIYLGSNDMAERVKYIGNEGKILSLEVMQEEKEPSEGTEKQDDGGGDLDKQEKLQTKSKVNLEAKKGEKQLSGGGEKRHDEESNSEKLENQRQRRKDKAELEDEEEKSGPAPEKSEKQNSEKRQEKQREKIQLGDCCTKVSYSRVSNCKKTVSAKKVSSLNDIKDKRTNLAATKRSSGQRLCLSIGFNDSFICLRGKEVKTS